LAGGKGRVIGLILSILLLGTIQNGMGLANIQGPVQTLVIGLILIASIVVPVAIGAVGGAASRAKNIAEKDSASSK
jgi:rhamnose transport system permease protein